MYSFTPSPATPKQRFCPVFGAEAAARYYFRTPAANLAPAQAARLAVMLPNPRYYDRHRSTNYLVKRTSLIQRRMGAAELP